MDKKILKVRTPFRALLYSVFNGEMDAFTKSAVSNKAENRSNLALKLQTNSIWQFIKRKLAFIPTKVIQLLLGICFLAFLFAMLGLSMGKAAGPLVLAKMVTMTLFMTTLFLSFTSSISMLFMSDDVIYYMTLPFKDRDLVKAKFWQFAYGNMLLDLPIFLALFLGAAWSGHYSADLVVRGVIYVILCCISSKIVLLFLLFLLISKVKFFKNRDRFVKVASSVMLVFFICIGAGSQLIANFSKISKNTGSALAITNTFMTANSIWGKILLNVFNLFSLPGFLAEQIFGANTVTAYLYLALSVIVVALLLVALFKYASANYLPIIRSLQGAGNSAKKVMTRQEIKTELKVRSPYKSLAYVDKCLVKRTPNLFTNFTLTPLLMPLYMFVCFFIGGIGAASKNGFKLADVAKFIAQNKTALAEVSFKNGAVFGILIAITFALVLTNLSSMANAEILRDGRNFIFYRTMPLKMQTYLQVKLKRGFIYYCAIIEAMIILGVVVCLLCFGMQFSLAALIIAYTLALQISILVSALIVAAYTAKFDFDLETELVRQLKGFKRILINFGGLLIVALPLVLLVFVGNGFTFTFDFKEGNMALIVTIWQCVYMLALLVFYFGPLAKYLARKSL